MSEGLRKTDRVKNINIGHEGVKSKNHYGHGERKRGGAGGSK